MWKKLDPFTTWKVSEKNAKFGHFQVMYIFSGLVSVDSLVLLHNLWAGGRGVQRLSKG